MEEGAEVVVVVNNVLVEVEDNILAVEDGTEVVMLEGVVLEVAG